MNRFIALSQDHHACAMDFCFGVANDTWPGGRLLSANKKHGEVNLDDLDVGWRSR
jgi:hypothetical protein